MDPLFFFLLGHIIGDYALQTDRMAADKNRIGPSLIVHAMLYGASIILSTLVYDLVYAPPIFLSVWPWIIPVLLIHLIQDFIKARYCRGSRQIYYIDQVLHLTALYALRIIAVG